GRSARMLQSAERVSCGGLDMSEGDFTVFIVDDDPGVLKALSRLLNATGYQTRAFSSSRAFLADHDPSIPGCAVLDFAMPDLHGLQLQEALSSEGAGRQIIFLTGKGDILTSVRAMKDGAIDFLTKPVSYSNLLSAIDRARERDFQARQIRRERADIE